MNEESSKDHHDKRYRKFCGNPKVLEQENISFKALFFDVPQSEDFEASTTFPKSDLFIPQSSVDRTIKVILLKILLGIERSVIPRQFSWLEESPFLSSFTISFLDQSFGMVPSLHTEEELGKDSCCGVDFSLYHFDKDGIDACRLTTLPLRIHLHQ